MTVNQTSLQVPQSLQNGAGCIKVVSGSGFRYLVPFPYKLHQMLEETELKGDAYTSIVSWLPDGSHFKVHDSGSFMKHVVPQYFKQKSYKSFQRQLHIYGFKRILKGDLQGAFHHPKFIKGNRNLTHEIDRIKAPVARKNARPSMGSTNSESASASGVSSCMEAATVSYYIDMDIDMDVQCVMDAFSSFINSIISFTSSPGRKHVHARSSKGNRNSNSNQTSKQPSRYTGMVGELGHDVFRFGTLTCLRNGSTKTS